ncbi:MAG: hypothetical protein ACLR13_03740 [Acutalibacteraceae bacterium]
MPTKIETETQLLRLLGNSPLCKSPSIFANRNACI